MSFDHTTTPSAGWYPDPSGSGGQRWWDGTAWTPHVRQQPASDQPAPASNPYAAASAQPAPTHQQYVQPYSTQQAPQYAVPAAIPGVPAGTPVYTWFIWVAVLLPLLPAIFLGLFDFSGYLAAAVTSPNASLQMMTSPGYLGLMAASWVSYFAIVALAFGDYRALTRLGYQRPFHWAWAFLSNVVYVIGRSVVVRRRSGSGLLPIWVMIAVYVITLIVTIMKFVAAISVVMSLAAYHVST